MGFKELKLCEQMLFFNTRILNHMKKSPQQLRISLRKNPSQDRSAFTVNSILEAATRVLEESSLNGFNTNRVAELAGVSVGSLYQYFPNKDALIAQLIIADHERLADAISSCLTLSQIVKVAVAHHWGNPVLAAALDHEEERLPLEKYLATFRERVITALVTLLNKLCPNLSKARYTQAAVDGLVICKALVEAAQANESKKALEARITKTLEAVLAARLFQPKTKRARPRAI